MERNILDVQTEIRAWELKRDNLQRELEAGADGMCYMTFLRYLNTEIPPEPEPAAQLRRQGQLSLFR